MKIYSNGKGKFFEVQKVGTDGGVNQYSIKRPLNAQETDAMNKVVGGVDKEHIFNLSGLEETDSWLIPDEEKNLWR